MKIIIFCLCLIALPTTLRNANAEVMQSDVVLAVCMRTLIFLRVPQDGMGMSGGVSPKDQMKLQRFQDIGSYFPSPLFSRSVDKLTWGTLLKAKIDRCYAPKISPSPISSIPFG
jgi:hypothetical protein